LHVNDGEDNNLMISKGQNMFP